ncbi:MAG: hypothetical protein ACLR8Y_02035 [Alistipes indistinctus]
MRESLFIEYVRRIFPKLQTIIEKINGKRGNQQTYLHKTMLRKEYSADQRWESASVNTTYAGSRHGGDGSTAAAQDAGFSGILQWAHCRKWE